MTIGLAWIGKRADGREHLYIASDSRVTGGQRLDACPKILTLPRSDCTLCFAGHTAATFPLMIQRKIVSFDRAIARPHVGALEWP